MLRRAIILGLFPLAIAIGACVLVAAAVIGLLWGNLALKHPGDPSAFDIVAWILIFSAPIWVVLLPIVGLTAGTITYFIARRRFDSHVATSKNPN